MLLSLTQTLPVFVDIALELGLLLLLFLRTAKLMRSDLKLRSIKALLSGALEQTIDIALPLLLRLLRLTGRGGHHINYFFILFCPVPPLRVKQVYANTKGMIII